MQPQPRGQVRGQRPRAMPQPARVGRVRGQFNPRPPKGYQQRGEFAYAAFDGRMAMESILIGCAVFGALIGYVAAEKRGWSPVAGVLGGALLGILSPLMFFASGVSKNDRSKVCPQCAERVKAEAKVCRFCQHQFV